MNLVPRVLTCLTFVIPLFVSGCEAFDKNGNEAVYPGPDAGVDVGPLTEWACSDGLDDDGDGLTDCADLDCMGLGYCTVTTCNCLGTTLAASAAVIRRIDWNIALNAPDCPAGAIALK